MMLTTEQAAEVWCPMKADKAAAFSKCSADKCAMWRWGETKQKWKLQIVERSVAYVDRPPELRKFEERHPVDVPYRGYCGLAGAPVIAQGQS